MKFLYFVLSLILYCLLAYVVERADFLVLISIWSALFGLYFLLSNINLSQKEIFIFGLCFRLVWVFAIPTLSDDFYRFVWDGRLLANGLNPYLILPADFIHSSQFQAVIGDIDLFAKLNSPNYYTVYPPLNQWFFAFSAWVSGKNLFANVIALRAIILMGEVAVFYLILKSGFKNQKSNIKHLSFYFLNPLIIIELCGNLHFEGLTLLFVLLAILLITRGLYFGSATALALAINIKMLPCMFIVLIINKLSLKKAFVYCLVVAFFCSLWALCFVDNLWITRLFSSVNLYFQKFEFNASIYYLVREWGYSYYGYNIIGKAGIWLIISSFSLILWLSFRLKNQDLFTGFLLILSSYFAFALIIHPWYICTLVGLSVFTKFRFPLVWSAMVGLSYFAYSNKLFQENLWLIALEYTVVYGFLIYELVTKQPFASTRDTPEQKVE
jgi:hypothetical protein